MIERPRLISLGISLGSPRNRSVACGRSRWVDTLRDRLSASRRMTSSLRRPRFGPDHMLPGELPVRWLADFCDLPSVEVFPRLASAQLTEGHAISLVAGYVAYWIRQPDPGSVFERTSRD